MEVLVGHCAKLVPVRSRIEEAMTFASLLERTRAKVLDAGTHQACSYGRMLQGLSVERATGRLPLVEVAFNMDRNIPCRLEGLSTRFSLNPKAAVHFDLFFNLTEGDGTLTIDCDYNRDILDEETVRRWMRHYVTLISTAIASPDVRLCDLPLLSAAEKSLLVSAGNATVWLHRGAETVHGLFATQATQTPDRVALIDPEGALTYGELHHRARRLAQVLRKRGIGPGSVVGLLVDRCSWMVAGLLGILETGAAYLPIAPDWPDDRMRFVLEDAAADLLLSDDPSPIPDSRTPVARIDEDLAIGEPRGMARSEPDSLAYVIYTSGSTGRPKGVQVPHRAVVNLLESMAERPGLDANDRLLAVTTIGFDIAALEIFLPLVVGGTVILVSRPVASHGLQLLWTIRETAPTLLQATPSSWRLLIDSGWDGRPPLKVLCGGEALPRDLRDALLERSENVWNLYGPTETTIWSSCARLSEPNETVVIGRPIAGTELYVVDRFGQIAPPGAPGELYIGGKGLARGYRSRPELTAERYLPDWLGDRSGGRLYRTGDVARYRADGQVEYLGRADDQLKIRGYRIEPGEIEALLVECCHVKECVVVARELQPDDVRLLAYFVPRAGRAPTRTEIRQELRLKLPDSMIPQYFVELESIPRTSNGKVDRRALPDVLRVSGLDQPPAPPETRAEKMLAELWSHALDQQKVSVSDNFFALGGHSLLAMKLLLEIERRTGCRLNPMSFVFDTLGQIAARLETSWNPVEAVERRAESSHPAVGLGSRLFRAFRSRVH
jgi:amino acid adenylation domain-containing protein